MNKIEQRHAKFYVYMLRCNQGSLYTGYTKDIDQRIESHSKGLGAKYLKGRGPLKLVYVKEYAYYRSALNAERKIKAYNKERKEELIKIYENK